MPLAVGKPKMLHLGKWALFQHLPRASGFSPIKDRGFPGGSVVKNLPASAGDTGSIPGLGRSPGGENGNPLLYSCQENPMDRGA